MAIDLDIFLLERQWLTRSYADGLLDDVDAGDHFGDGVLDLNTGVDFHEVEVFLGIHQELDSTGRVITGGFTHAGGSGAELLAFFIIEDGARGLFDELLLASLHGAVAFPEVDDVAVLVTEDLDLNVPRVINEFLDIDGAIAKSGLGFLAGGLDTRDERAVIVSDAHTPSAASSCGLDHDGVSDLACDLQSGFFIGDCTL